MILDSSDQAGGPGDTLTFTGILFNNGLSAIFLNRVNLNLAGNSFTPDFIGPFLNNVPFSLGSGQSTLKTPAGRCRFRVSALPFGAGDGDRTRDVELGNMLLVPRK